MQHSTQADDLLMSLVEDALALPDQDRRAYLQSACGTDSGLFARAWNYIEWEQRMEGFLLDPFLPPVEDDHPLKPGQMLINRFRILREVAQGGMGVVWEALDEKLNLRVAIKLAKAGFGNRLPPEVRHARDISHPNVCNIFEIHTMPSPQGEIDFISMEFVEGETLSERLQRGPLSKQERLTIALQLCAGLSEAHRNNVIHGDLKSNNIILTTGPDGSVRAVIMDFGLAHKPDSLSSTYAAEGLAGTPAYMAPELWKGVKPSAASDIYALGVLLWELASGKTPSDLGVTSSTLAWGERPAWKPPTGYGKWDRVIAGCLEADPARRFQSVGDVARAIGPSRTRRRYLAAAAAVLLAIVSALVTYREATAPPETVRLAMLPFAFGNSISGISDALLRDTAKELARLKSSAHTRFKFIPTDKISRNRVDTTEKARAVLGATHVLQGVLEQGSRTMTVHAYLTDVRSGANAGEWTAEYKPGEMRYAPAALTGVVTSTLHLPLVKAPTVSAAASKDYKAGLLAVGRDSGVDAALGLFERAVAADPDSPLTYAGLAEAQWFKYNATRDKRWLDRAAESVRRAEIRNPDLGHVHSVAGLLKANTGRYDQAAAEYLRAIELDPTNGDAYRRLGETYERNNQLEEALAVFRKAVKVDPQHYKSFGDLGRFYYERANYEEAAKYLWTAVELAPDEPLVHRSLGVALMALGRFEGAEQELRTSIRLRETAVALHTLGYVLMYQGRDRQAIPIIARALALGPERHLWWMNLGTAYRRVGLASQSRQAYRRGLELAQADIAKNPSSGSVRSHLAYLCAQLGERRSAESDIAQALQQSPNEADTRWMAAITYEALDRRNDALSVLAASPVGVLADVARWPDVADLSKDSRFLQLLNSHSEK